MQYNTYNPAAVGAGHPNIEWTRESGDLVSIFCGRSNACLRVVGWDYSSL